MIYMTHLYRHAYCYDGRYVQVTIGNMRAT